MWGRLPGEGGIWKGLEGTSRFGIKGSEVIEVIAREDRWEKEESLAWPGGSVG